MTKIFTLAFVAQNSYGNHVPHYHTKLIKSSSATFPNTFNMLDNITTTICTDFPRDNKLNGAYKQQIFSSISTTNKHRTMKIKSILTDSFIADGQYLEKHFRWITQ